MHILGDVGVDGEGQRGIGQVCGVEDCFSQQQASLGALVRKVHVTPELGGQAEVEAHVRGQYCTNDDLSDLLHSSMHHAKSA